MNIYLLLRQCLVNVKHFFYFYIFTSWWYFYTDLCNAVIIFYLYNITFWLYALCTLQNICLSCSIFSFFSCTSSFLHSFQYFLRPCMLCCGSVRSDTFQQACRNPGMLKSRITVICDMESSWNSIISILGFLQACFSNTWILFKNRNSDP